MEAIKNPQVEIGARLLKAAADLRPRATLVAQKQEREHRPGFFGVFHFPSHGCGGQKKTANSRLFSVKSRRRRGEIRFADEIILTEDEIFSCGKG